MVNSKQLSCHPYLVHMNLNLLTRLPCSKSWINCPFFFGTILFFKKHSSAVAGSNTETHGCLKSGGGAEKQEFNVNIGGGGNSDVAGCGISWNSPAGFKFESGKV